MNARELLEELRRQGVEVSATGDRLAMEGPDRLLTPDLLETVRAHKRELLALLVEAEPPAITLPPREGCPETAALAEAAGSAFVAYFNRWANVLRQPWPVERRAELDALAALSRPSWVWARLSDADDDGELPPGEEME